MAKIPEHPDIAKERRRERWAIVFGVGGIIIFFGVGLFFFAAYAQYYWRGRAPPPDVLASINQEFTVSYWLMGIGVGVLVAGYLVWLYLRRRARPAYER